MKYRNRNFKEKKQNKTTFTATVSANERGFAFLIPEDKQKYTGDFFVPRTSLNGAYDGDKVLAIHVRGTKDEAKILKVLERGNTRIVGTFGRTGNIGRVYPDDMKLPEILVPLALSLNAKDGDKLLCEITSFPPKGLPKGKAIEILGESGEFETEELSIIRAHGLYEQFPQEVIDEAQKVAGESVILGKRADFRDKLIFTIDGADTRDIDDAVSLEVKDGKYLLGVHIADVSHYVKYRSALDNEAYKRGTSVYFPDRVLPMLPKELSNGACSLNEGEDRYSISCLMIFDKNAKRLEYKVCESVINSRHKMTYSAVNAILSGDSEACAKYADIVETVNQMQKLCLTMEKNRKSAGEVNLEVREAKIYIDDDGNIVIPDYERGISERIIEQFMISANEAVAEFLIKNKAPCLFRVHESPSPEKASTLLSFMRDLGVKAKCDVENVKPKDFQNILKSVEDKPYYSVVNKVMLRSMQKARYCEENLGHFGLASECYCHFTSPIRRYPDLFVHRALKCVFQSADKANQNFEDASKTRRTHGGEGERTQTYVNQDGGHSTKYCEVYAKFAKQAGVDCSERERIADEAERAVDDLYKVVYMSDRIGEVYDATVSGVTNFGVFCELDNTVEGLIPLDILPDDSYEHIAEKFLLKGARHSYRLGDKVKIRVENCDFGRMRVMFSLYR